MTQLTSVETRLHPNSQNVTIGQTCTVVRPAVQNSTKVADPGSASVHAIIFAVFFFFFLSILLTCPI